MKKKTRTKPQKIGIKPIHPIATFTPVRRRLNLFTKLETSIATLFPPGITLTDNQLKVWIVLLAARMGRTNLAAIDQEKIAEISNIRQPHVARAIAGLRKKGLVMKTLMQAGLKMFRNIYVLWMPPELLERDINAMLRKREKAVVLEKQAEDLEKQSASDKADKLRDKAQTIRASNCSFCGGEGIVLRVYIPSEKRERACWCSCSLGRKKAEEFGGLNGAFVPDSILKKMLKLH